MDNPLWAILEAFINSSIVFFSKTYLYDVLVTDKGYGIFNVRSYFLVFIL